MAQDSLGTCMDSTAISKIEELPWLALERILQQLDQHSLASTAVTCSRLNHAVPAHISKVALQRPKGLSSFVRWMQRHSTRLTCLTHCSIIGHEHMTLGGFEGVPSVIRLPPQLRQLHLQRLTLQLGPKADRQGSLLGLLHGCSSLTALHLWDCRTSENTPAAFAAITALPALRRLEIALTHDTDRTFLLAALPQRPWNLSALSLTSASGLNTQHLGQLSALTTLQELKLVGLQKEGIPGGVPCQLVQLTCLRLHYGSKGNPGQLQHLSNLTALQNLSVKDGMLAADTLPGIEHLSKLTSFSITSPVLIFTNAGSQGKAWHHLTALHKLALFGCVVEPQALEAITQLRALSLDGVIGLQPATIEQLLRVSSKLTLLTQLTLSFQNAWQIAEGIPSADAFKALTASTCLHSLQLGMHGPLGFSWGYIMFTPGQVLPCMRSLDLQYGQRHMGLLHVSEQQLQQLCSCCPALESLEFWLDPAASPEACLPLRQLTGLTRLQVFGLGDASAAATTVGVAAQLTGLKELTMTQLGKSWTSDGMWEPGSGPMCTPILLRLTTLTALTQLKLRAKNADMLVTNQATLSQPPDVWRQLRKQFGVSSRADLVLARSPAVPERSGTTAADARAAVAAAVHAAVAADACGD